MTKYILMPDGSKCWSGISCKRHSQKATDWVTEHPGIDHIRLSKNISYILRHKPESVGLALEDEGWVQVNDLISAINSNVKIKRPIAFEDIIYVVSNDSKQRYALAGSKIRAVQGHSTIVDMKYIPKEPPMVLYHGTTDESWKIIKRDGLRSMRRQYVHLTSNPDTAINVGNRHGDNVRLLKVNANDAYKAGVKFFLAENGVWLSEEIPNRFLGS